MGRIADCCVVTVIFIVRLPSGDMRVFAIAFRHQLGDPACLLAIAIMAEAIMPAGAKFSDCARLIMGQHIGMLVEHPTRRRGCGRA